jgi:16S rRNA (cytosine1402-N4)-methyltransferase
MLAAVVTGLHVRTGAWIIDGTLGGGGHTAAILERSAPDGRVLGLDSDPAAIHRVGLSQADAVAAGRLVLVQTGFEHLEQAAAESSLLPVDGVLLDLGVSSFQLETAERGFSFQLGGPLDMRFDPEQGLDAAEIVNSWDEEDLANLLFRFGEEQQSRRIARYLVRHRPFHTTIDLAQAVARAVGGRKDSRIHPATRTFQALRIAVNRELQQLQAVLPQALRVLRPGGRLVVISFHSLEDRIVKQWMQQEARQYVPDPTSLYGGYERQPTLRIVTRKPVEADEEELTRNPRSRSAKLRIAEKL